MATETLVEAKIVKKIPKKPPRPSLALKTRLVQNQIENKPRYLWFIFPICDKILSLECERMKLQDRFGKACIFEAYLFDSFDKWNYGRKPVTELYRVTVISLDCLGAIGRQIAGVLC